MKVELKDLSPVKKSLSIEAESEEIARETDEVVRRYARQARIPGFRQGKVPTIWSAPGFRRRSRKTSVSGW